ncbi:MAG: peptidylprolyl isomerase [Desulfuromonadales bacterium]
MALAKTDDRVKVHYTGRLENGATFDSSEESAPLEFTVGRGDVIPGFEQAVIGMQIGESKTVRIPAKQAYGEHHEQLVTQLRRGDVPADMELQVGNQLEVTQENGEKFLVMVAELTEEMVTLDANHPLAGKELIFDIQLLEIN